MVAKLWFGVNMNNSFFNAFSLANNPCRHRRAKILAKYSRLLLGCWLLTTAGCAGNSKLASFAAFAFDTKTATTGQLGNPAKSHRAESTSEFGQSTGSMPTEGPSPQPQVELVNYEDQELEVLPVPLEHTPSGDPMAESSMQSEQLPQPATLPPIVNAVAPSPQQGQVAPPMPTSTVGPQVVNLRGASFRQPPKTATEIMLALKSENDRLRHQLAVEKRNFTDLTKQLKEQLKEQLRTSQHLAGKVDRGYAEAARLREMVSKLQVQVDFLIAEKDKIKKDSEAALRGIESKLDAVLLNSISKTLQKPGPTN